MQAMRILLDEHQSLAAIIHAIRHMIREIGSGKLKPDFKLLHAMVHYLDAYPEKKHHPKEDVFLFAPLRARTDKANAVLERRIETMLEGIRTTIIEVRTRSSVVASSAT